jgi:prepilin-type N-terminal cleavage/methylation domain-containing protein
MLEHDISMGDKMKFFRNRGFTLVELLVVIAIIGILISLLMPAVQSAREAGRRLSCINNLKQIGLAVLNHENATKRFPTGGWGWKWVGDPDRGNSQNQPGGWAYNILPFLEQNNLHNLCMGLKGPNKYDAAADMIDMPLPEFICPSRRTAMRYPYHPGISPQTFNATSTSTSSRTDYAVNRGDFFVDRIEGPTSYEDTYFKWPDTTQITGISFIRSMIKATDITDGQSNTYLIGEKYINPLDYSTGRDPGDDSSICQGDDYDNARFVGHAHFIIKNNQSVIEDVPVPPVKDMRTYSDSFCFGSAHPSTWQVSLCDGSVHTVNYDIDSELHRRLGNRCDGQLVDKSEVN